MGNADFEPSEHAAGLVVASKYRLERLIGEGAIAHVYEATNVDLGGRVALKFLKQEHAQNTEIVARFQAEARAVARLRNPHVAMVMDLGMHAGSPFIVMEFLQGEDLRSIVNRCGPMPMENVAEILIQASAALAEAHGLGIVHRDIKPDNLFLVDPDQSWKSLKVLDFGISKVNLQVKPSLQEKVSLVQTRATQVIGSPHYMSPEQIRSSRDVDGRSDIWSLGVVMYELLTGGQKPFNANDLAALVYEILRSAPKAFPHGSAAVRPAFLQIMHRCLAKEADARYQTAADLAWALFPFVPNRAMQQSVERARHLTPAASFSVTEIIRQGRNAPMPPRREEPVPPSAQRTLPVPPQLRVPRRGHA